MDKMPCDNTAWHNDYFKTNDLLRVDCGGKGNCFYHVCLFLVTMFLPDKLVDGMTHMTLRNATVNHLQTHHAVITSDHGPVSLLLEGAGDCCDDTALNAIVDAYCEKARKRGEYVEDPCVLSFAHRMEIQIHVHHTRVPGVQLYNESASGGILTLWCDGNHYQVTLNPKPKTLNHQPSNSQPVNSKPKPYNPKTLTSHLSTSGTCEQTSRGNLT
jgi:hypothetical protein